MSDSKKIELFKSKEKKSQLKERFEKEGYNWKEVKEKLEIISKKEEIDKKLDELQWNIDENYNYLKWLLEKYKDDFDWKESLLDTAKKSVEDKIEAEKSKLKEKLLQKTKDIPIIWWLLYKALKWVDESKEEKTEDWFFEKTKKSFFWWLWGSLLSIFGWFIAYDNYKEEIERLWSKLWDELKKWFDSMVWKTEKKPDLWKVWEVPETSFVEPTVEKKETKEEEKGLKENIDKIFYPAWFRLIISLSWEKLIKEVSVWKISEGLSEVSYNDFLDKAKNQDFKDNILWEEKENQLLKDQYDKVYESLSSKNTKDLLRIGLKAEIVEKILLWKDKNKENIKIKNEIWEERFTEILDSIKNNNFDYKKLKIKELSILYLHTIPVFTSWALSWVADELNIFAHDIIWWWSELKDTLESSKWDFFSKNLLEKLLPTKTEIIWKDLDSLIAELKIVDKKDKEDLEKLVVFKNEVFTEKFLNNKKLMLDDNTKNILSRKMDYKHIIALYGIMWWNSNLDELSPINMPIVLALLYNIIKSWNNFSDSMTASNYIKNYVKNSLLPDNWKDIFTEDEKTVMKIYGKKLLDIFIISYLEKFYSWTWLVTNKEWLRDAALISWASWVTLRYIWVKWTKKALKAWKLPFLSWYLRKAWWVWIISWLAFGWLSIIWDNEQSEHYSEKFDSDLEKAYNDVDAKRVIELIESHDKWVKEYDFDWKKLFLVSYEWKEPYVIYDGKIYAISVFEDTQTVEWTLRWLVPFLERDNTYNWESIKEVRVEWDEIIFWDKVITINFKSLQNEGLEKINLPTDTLSNLTELAKKTPFFWDSTFWWKSIEILKLWADEKGTIVGLMPIWELELKTL